MLYSRDRSKTDRLRATERETKMNEDELKLILMDHEQWLADNNTGKRADLRYADLEVQIRGANLKRADLNVQI